MKGSGSSPSPADAETSKLAELSTIAREKLKIGGYHRHIFICTGPECCTSEDGLKSWNHLKNKLNDLGLRSGQIFATKVGCLRVCKHGPVGVVYPDGTWYRDLTPEHIDAIVEDHLIGGEPVESLSFATGPLTGNPAVPKTCK